MRLHALYIIHVRAIMTGTAVSNIIFFVLLNMMFIYIDKEVK